METPAFTTDNLTALNNAIAQGAKRVKYSDKEIEYNSLSELLQLRRLMMRELGLSNGSGRIFTNVDKGL